MTILFFIYSRYPSKNGVSVVTQYLVEGMKKKGHSVWVITCGENETIEEIDGYKIIRLNIRYNLFKRPSGELNKMDEYVRNVNADVMVFECLQTPFVDYYLPQLNSLSSVKVLHSHDFSGLYLVPFNWKGDLRNTISNFYNCLIWRLYYSKFIPRYINGFDKVMCLTSITKDYDYLEQYYAGEKYILSNSAEDIFFNEDVADTYRVVDISKYFLSVANYGNVKNQIGIIREYYKSDYSKEYSMVFCGSCKNKYYKKLIKIKKELDKKYGERSVAFLQGIKREKIPALMKNAKVYICGSYWEAFSISLIETMSVGTPFISTNVGNAKILSGGITVDDVNELHKAIDLMIRNEDLYNQCVKCGIDFTRKNCRISQAIDCFETIIC